MRQLFEGYGLSARIAPIPDVRPTAKKRDLFIPLLSALAIVLVAPLYIYGHAEKAVFGQLVAFYFLAAYSITRNYLAFTLFLAHPWLQLVSFSSDSASSVLLGGVQLPTVVYFHLLQGACAAVACLLNLKSAGTVLLKRPVANTMVNAGSDILLLKILAEATSAQVLLLNREGRVVYISESAKNGLGRALPALALGELWSQIVVPENSTQAKYAWYEVMSRGQSEFSVPLADAETSSSVGFQLSTFRERNDQVDYVLVAVHNTSVSPAQRELNAIVNSMNGPFVALDGQGQVRLANDCARTTFDLDGEPLEGSDGVSVLEQRMGAGFGQCLRESLRRSRSSVHRRLDKTLNVWFEVNICSAGSGAYLFFSEVEAPAQKQEKQALKKNTCRTDIASHGGWEYSVENNRLYFSESAKEILDLPAEQHAFRLNEVRSLFSGESQLSLIRAFLYAIQDSQESVWEGELRTNKEKFITVRVSLCGQPSATGEQQKVVGTIQDISVQHARESYLEEASRFVRGIINSLSLEVGVIHHDGKIVQANKSWSDNVSSTAFPQVGQNFLQFIGQELVMRSAERSALVIGVKGVVNGEQSQFSSRYQVESDAGITCFQFEIKPLNPSVTGGELGPFVVTREDVSQIYELQASHQEQRQRFQLAVEATNDGVFDWNLSDDVCFFSERFRELASMPAEANPGFRQWFVDAVHPEDRTQAGVQLSASLNSGEKLDLQCRIQVGNDRSRWVRFRGKPIKIGENKTRFIGSMMDVHEQKSLLTMVSRREKRFREMAEHMPDVFWDYDIIEGQFVYVSPAFTRVWKWPQSQALGSELSWWFSTLVDDDKHHVINAYDKCVNEGRGCTVHYRIIDHDGKKCWIESKCFPIKDQNGITVRLVGTARDISESEHQKQTIRRFEKNDLLTGLPNRASLQKYLESRCKDRLNTQKTKLLVLVDLDRFSRVNESIGYGRGDELLKIIAARLEEVASDTNYIARTGGDEFGLYFEIDELAESADRIVERVQCLFSHAFYIDDYPIYINASIGVAVVKGGNAEAEVIRAAADHALEQAERDGGGCYRVREVDIHGPINAKPIHLESELCKAIDENEFELFYQLKVSAETEQAVSCEALLRWHHKALGLVSPAEFIPMLEQSGLIVPVGNKILEDAIIQKRRWEFEYGIELPVAVNVSARQVGHPSFYDTVVRLCHEYALRPGELELELTETSLMADPDAGVTLIENLKSMGISIALDDFGTGVSSLSYIRRFSPDIIKIDRCFVNDIEHDNNARDLVAGILALSKKLNIKVVAEGIENDAQSRILREFGCDILQGFYFARPQPAEEVMALLTSKNRNL